MSIQSGHNDHCPGSLTRGVGTTQTTFSIKKGQKHNGVSDKEVKSSMKCPIGKISVVINFDIHYSLVSSVSTCLFNNYSMKPRWI